jgi:hypothetical protein
MGKTYLRSFLENIVSFVYENFSRSNLMRVQKAVLFWGLISLLILSTLPALAESGGIVLGDSADVFTVDAGITVSNGVGSGVEAGGGNDQITNNGVISSLVFGIDGGVGNDSLTNNGEIRDGEVGLYGSRGDDTLTNNGVIIGVTNGIEGGVGNNTVINTGTINALVRSGILNTGSVTNRPSGQIYGWSHGIEAGGNITNSGYTHGTLGHGILGSNGRDTIVNTAEGIASGGSGVGINAWGGNDIIENYGLVEGDINGWLGNDRIIIYGGVVTGVISGGADRNTLVFAATVSAQDLASLSQRLADADPAIGSITINGVEYRWAYFSVIENKLVARR